MPLPDIHPSLSKELAQLADDIVEIDEKHLRKMVTGTPKPAC